MTATALTNYDTAVALAFLPTLGEDSVSVKREESVMAFLRTRLVLEEEYWKAHRLTGSIYFIRNASADTIKIGHSGDPRRRMQQLQVANSARLELIGVVAAEIAIEKIVHSQLTEGRIDGEWFWDRGVTTEWLVRMTQDQPLYRHVWELVE